MRHASLFSGIGGFDLAASWMGWENVFQCEIDSFCNKVLQKHFPQTIRYGDIKKTEFSEWRGKIDIVSGGFPCQPYSTAGKRKGDKDDRHLWPEMLRAIGEIQPNWVIGENVPGLISWAKGMVFRQIQTDLEAKGFEVFPPIILPACSKEAPHERGRVWIVAHSSCVSKEQRKYKKSGILERVTGASERIDTNFDSKGLQIGIQSGIGITGKENGAYQGGQSSRISTTHSWKEFPIESPFCGGDDGIPNRVDRIGSLGNAVVPQLVFEIFKAIDAYENLNP